MKILAAGDIHGDMISAKRLAYTAHKEDVDLVILCGDVTFFEREFKDILHHFKEKRVLMLPGNHENLATTQMIADVYGFRNIHGISVKYDDIGIFGAGGCTKVGPSPIIPESEMDLLLSQGFEGIKYLPKKIMVTHEHPADSIIELNKTFLGSKSIRDAIDKMQPDILICGHIHEAEGIEQMIGKTRVINVGKKGKIFEF